MPPAAWSITLLDGFAVAVDGRAVPPGGWRHRRGAELVKLLALAPRHRLHREQVMVQLWPDLDGVAATTNLRKAVHFARRALGADSAITVEREIVALCPDEPVTVDVAEFEAVARQALRSADPAGCAAAAGRYPGDLLPDDRYAPWADEQRERLRLLYLELLRAAEAWSRVLEIEPSDEQAHRALMAVALARGDRAAVIRQFERLRGRLRADFGVGPERQSVQLYERALAMSTDEPVTPAQRARALLAWGLVHFNSGDLAEAERAARQARALAVDAELGREVGEASALLGMVANMQGRWRELFRSEFAQAVRQRPRLAVFVFDAHLCLAEFCLCGPAGHEEIAGYARELLDVAERAGSVQGCALANLVLGEGSLFSDDLDAAERLLTSAAELHERADATSGQALALQRLAEVAIARGQRWRAGRLLRQARRLTEASELEPHLLVRTLGAEVGLAQNVAAVRHADEVLAGREVCAPCSMGYRVAAAIALARAGALSAARQRLVEAERIAGMWHGGPWLASVWEARALLRRAEGDEPQAVALLNEAAGQFASVGRPRDERRCRELIRTSRTA